MQLVSFSAAELTCVNIFVADPVILLRSQPKSIPMAPLGHLELPGELVFRILRIRGFVGVLGQQRRGVELDGLPRGLGEGGYE